METPLYRCVSSKRYHSTYVLGTLCLNQISYMKDRFLHQTIVTPFYRSVIIPESPRNR
jgi:hypothetical protein